MLVTADLHNHSCLSPCGDLEMSPSAMVMKAKELGIRMLALTDHNSALNTPAFEFHCQQQGILPLFGIEVTSFEEAHLLCLFQTVEQAMDLSKELYRVLPAIKNDSDKLGDQVYVDKDDMIEGEVEHHLTNAVSWTIDQVRQRTIEDKGLFIPAHVDKPVFSLISQLGFIPNEFYHALEITKPDTHPDYYDNKLITNSDAHFLHSMGTRKSIYEMGDLSFKSFTEALSQGHYQIFM
ncbi:PHP domain-containing protein [Spirochaeta cellobiosiphila]|uniref:PHP domain-containing protein n=1 Tax=Spirochaeta cellobiosiphila TaxID=504483 RepID=UPI00042730A8|nr:PHP domain-containing protein [Spirochaeta cellobiosiphila]